MAPFYCALCLKDVDELIDEHIASQHDSPDKKKHTVGGQEMQLTDGEFVKASLTSTPKGKAKAVTFSLPARDPVTELGVLESDIISAKSTVVGGGSCTKREANAAFDALEKTFGDRINKAQWLVDFVEWGVRNGFTEELQDAGGFDIETSKDLDPRSKFFTVETMQREIERSISSQFGRKFTFRRFGRYLGPSIPRMFEKNEQLSRLFETGTPLSNRLGVEPALLLATSSIFDSIKPYAMWTEAERDAHNAAVRAVEKQPRQASTAPRDLRPQPDVARQAREELKSDFARAHPGLAKDFGSMETLVTKKGEVKPYVRPYESLKKRFNFGGYE
jgi:hypothetical protein